MKKAIENYDYNSAFPSRFRMLTEEHSVTQQDIADLCGTKRQSVSHWLNGETRPDILSLVKIAEHFKVSTDYLLGLADYKTTDKATLEACKALGLTEDAVKLLSGDATQNIARTFNRLADEHVKEYTYMHEHLDEAFAPAPLLSLLQDFYIAIDAKSFAMLCDETFVGFDEDAAISAETESGYITSISFNPKEAFVTAAINNILARLHKIKTENK